MSRFATELDTLPDEVRSPAEKFREALALHEEGVELQRLKLRRLHPDATAEQIEELLERWLARDTS